jgi:hypothetical protein
VRYANGITPVVGQPTPGNATFAKDWIVGKSLGFQLYRIDLPAPVSRVIADRLAKQFTATREVLFAEPDSILSVNINTPQA